MLMLPSLDHAEELEDFPGRKARVGYYYYYYYYYYFIIIIIIITTII
jgi:hypothetical protein